MSGGNFEYKEMMEMYGWVRDNRNDIKWIKGEQERINGVYLTHIKEGENYRPQIIRNTIWRWVYKGGFSVLFLMLWYMIRMHLTNG